MTLAAIRRPALLMPLLLGVAVTAGAKQSEDPAVTTQLIDADGNVVGEVTVAQLANGVNFVAEFDGLPPGGHAFHIHERGRCEPPDFQSAGGHLNPLGKKHGFDNKQGYHAGDLPNIHVNEQGWGQAEFLVDRFRLSLKGESQRGSAKGPWPLLDENGSAIMIHAKPDDYEARPPDSAGARIACGELRVPE